MARNLMSTFLRRLNNLFYLTLRLVNYYPFFTYLHGRGQKLDITEEHELEFTTQEKAFLKACTASFNYFEFDFALGHRQKPISVYKLQDVTYLSHTGIILLNHKLIVESGLDVNRLTHTKAFRDFTVMLPRHYRTGTYTTIMHSHWADNNISHWFIDCLTRLYVLVKTVTEPVTILMWEGAHAYQKQTLEFLIQENPNLRVQYLSKNYRIRIENFLLPSFIASSYSAYVPPQVCQWLRENLWNSYQIKRNNPKKRLYISRSGASKRQLLNEAELLPVLKKYGFEAVWPEKLNYQQQVQLFFDAEAVISPHGAGLTNVLFSETCDVLELHPAKVMKAHYMLLCKGLGFNYTPIVGSSGNVYENFTVSIPEVEDWLLSKYKHKLA